MPATINIDGTSAGIDPIGEYHLLVRIIPDEDD